MRGPVDLALSLGYLSALLVTFLGLLVRKRFASCWSFTVYLPAVFATGILIAAWPERFYRWDFWLLKEALHSLIKFGIALELVLRTFRAFPGALATVRRLMLFVLMATYLVILSVPVNRSAPLEDLYVMLTTQVLPRIQNGTIWLFTAIAAVILWYRLPVQPLHKAILIGFVPYLLIVTFALNLLNRYWDLRVATNYMSASAYLLLTTYWAYVAWRPALEPKRPDGPPTSTQAELGGLVVR